MNTNLLSARLEWAKCEKEKRDHRAYKWADIARASGASTGAVSNWTKDVHGIASKFARPLAEWFGVDPVWLETGVGDAVPPGASEAPSLQPIEGGMGAPTRLTWISDAEERLLTLYRSTDDRGRATIMSAAEITPKVLLAGIANNNL
jgi:hypothetical protein